MVPGPLTLLALNAASRVPVTSVKIKILPEKMSPDEFLTAAREQHFKPGGDVLMTGRINNPPTGGILQ